MGVDVMSGAEQGKTDPINQDAGTNGNLAKPHRCREYCKAMDKNGGAYAICFVLKDCVAIPISIPTPTGNFVNLRQRHHCVAL